MTNTERLTSHNALIAEAIAKAEALPDAGSGGGAVETCTVELNFTGAVFHSVVYTYIDDTGNTNANFIDEAGMSDLTINNVVCGSFIAVFASSAFTTYGAVYQNCEHLNSEWFTGNELVFRITASAGETASITFGDSGVPEP